MIKHKTTQTDMKLASGTFDTNRACAVRSEGSSRFSLLVFKTDAPPPSSPRLKIIHNISFICKASSSQLHRSYVWCRRESFWCQVCPSLPFILGQRATKKKKKKIVRRRNNFLCRNVEEDSVKSFQPANSRSDIERANL